MNRKYLKMQKNQFLKEKKDFLELKDIEVEIKREIK